MKIKISKKIMVYNPPKKVIKFIKNKLTIPNPKWTENKAQGRWNGETEQDLIFYKKTVFYISTPIGFLNYLLIFLTKEKISYTLYYNQVENPVKYRFEGELRNYQLKSANDMLKYNEGTLEAPTGSGKTIIGLYLISELKQKTLIIVHTKELLYQWIDRIDEFLNIQKKDIGIIGDGKYHIGTKITVALIQSLYKKVPEIEYEFGCVLCDESHRVPSRLFTEAMNQLHCKYRIGLTATPFRNDGLDHLIFLFIGPVRHVIEKTILIEKGYILQPRFIMRSTNYNTKIDPTADYQGLMTELTENFKRNELIIDDIYNEKGTCLIISDRKSHCNYLYERLQSKYNITGAVLTGDVDTKTRKFIIDRVNSGKIKYLFATGQLIGEGFDCKNLNSLFITSPIKYAGRVIQYIGRVMRPAEGKEKPLIYDYVDWEIGPLRRSANGRIKVYGTENTVYD